MGLLPTSFRLHLYYGALNKKKISSSIQNMNKRLFGLFGFQVVRLEKARQSESRQQESTGPHLKAKHASGARGKQTCQPHPAILQSAPSENPNQKLIAPCLFISAHMEPR